MEELRAALKSHRVDEQGKEYVLDAAVDIDAQLSNYDADQQGSGDAAEDEAADLDFADEITERDRHEKREQGLCGEQLMQNLHCCHVQSRTLVLVPTSSWSAVLGDLYPARQCGV